MKYPLVIVAALSVSACVSQAPTQPVDVAFSSQSARKVGGFHVTNVRSFVKANGKSTEVTGVPCTLRGSGFSTSFQTPASVNVPTYGLASRAIEASCVYNGVTEKSTVAPVNITEDKAVATGASGGLLGALVVAAVVSGRQDKATDEFGYRNFRFEFEK